jgi:hypothetical protein
MINQPVPCIGPFGQLKLKGNRQEMFPQDFVPPMTQTYPKLKNTTTIKTNRK